MKRDIRLLLALLKWGMGGIVILFVLAVVVVAIFHRQLLPKLLLQPARHHDALQYVWHRLDLTKFQAVTADGLRLACWYAKTSVEPACGTCLLLHGHSYGKDGMLGLAERLNRRGYDVVAFDARAHGDSEGKLTTVGNLEGADAIAVVRQAESKFALPHPRIVIGTSLGAATAIRMITLPRHTMDGAIVISPYARLRDVVSREARQYLWFVDTGELLSDAEKIAGRPMWDFSPANLAPAISIPILIVHGGRDARFPIAEGREIFAAIPASVRKEFVDAEGAGHDDVLSSGNPWSEKVYGAFDRFLESMAAPAASVRH